MDQIMDMFIDEVKPFLDEAEKEALKRNDEDEGSSILEVKERFEETIRENDKQQINIELIEALEPFTELLNEMDGSVRMSFEDCKEAVQRAKDAIERVYQVEVSVSPSGTPDE